MSNEVIQASPQTIAQIKKFYTKEAVTRNAPGVVFAAKTANASITVYKSGKVLFQGAGSGIEARRWGATTTPSTSTKSSKGDLLPDHLGSLSVIGSDETGTGDFFGPVTVAACFVPAHQIELVQELGVKDSKQLTDDYMRKIAPDLQQTLIHSVLTLPNDKYNDIQEKGYSQGKIKALLHNQALKHVLRKMDNEKPDYIVIDQFAERKTYYKYLQDEPIIITERVLLATKAEGLHVAVAAASIIARVAFLEEMDRLSHQAGRTLPKGAGPKVDEIAAKMIMSYGEDALRSFTKKHFANTEKAKKLLNKLRNT